MAIQDNGKAVLWFGNVLGQDGFARIGTECLTRLQQRGYRVGAAGIFTQHIPFGHPFQVWGLAGHDPFGELQSIVSGMRPDVLVICQDFPYLINAANLTRLDYSSVALVGVTPIDGVPVAETWVKGATRFDALLTISRYGEKALRQQGARDRWNKPARHLPMGVDPQEFSYAPPEERAYLRSMAGLPRPGEALVLGGFMANQGRKCWGEVLELFGRYRAEHDPQAVLVCDTDRASPGGGWNLPELAEQIAWTRKLPTFKEGLRFRDELSARVKRNARGEPAGTLGLRDRMAVCDVALQLAYREGYGLPIAECQSVGTVTLAQDYCSGRELCGNGRGLLVRTSGPGRFGGWGNALDMDPDLDHALELLVMLRENPAEAAAIAERARKAVKRETWDACADALIEGVEDGLRSRLQSRASYAEATAAVLASAPGAPRGPAPGQGQGQGGAPLNIAPTGPGGTARGSGTPTATKRRHRRTREAEPAPGVPAAVPLPAAPGLMDPVHVVPLTHNPATRSYVITTAHPDAYAGKHALFISPEHVLHEDPDGSRQMMTLSVWLGAGGLPPSASAL